jgi:hypothetical protein
MTGSLSKTNWRTGKPLGEGSTRFAHASRSAPSSQAQVSRQGILQALIGPVARACLHDCVPRWVAGRPSVGKHDGGCQPRRLTPRAMTMTESTMAETDSMAMSILARCERGMVSVGLKADEFVMET